MDGMAHTIYSSTGRPPLWQARHGRPAARRTLKTSIGCVGVGLHSGRKVSLGLHPSAPGTGIVFRRTDVDGWDGGIDIPALFDRVIDTRMCTVLASDKAPDIRVGTAEHVLAALAGCGISDALITLDGPEVPILDGSSASFVFLIDCAGIIAHDAAVDAIEILRPVRVEQGAAFAELLPGGPGFDMTMSIDFDAAAIGSQSLSIVLSVESFRGELAKARTFTQAGEIERLRKTGLALGGSLDNAVVVDGDRVLNPDGLRMRDEFVRHKLLDAVGDLALAGVSLRGRFVGHRSGHALNNRLLRALFSDDANWAPLPVDVMAFGGAPIAGWPDGRQQIAAAPF